MSDERKSCGKKENAPDEEEEKSSLDRVRVREDKRLKYHQTSVSRKNCPVRRV